MAEPAPRPSSPPPAGGWTLAAVRALVERRFSVYDAQAGERANVFYVTVDAATVEESFRLLKDDMKPLDLIPLLKYEGGEHSVYVLERPRRAYRSRKVNLTLFILTWITTTFAGAGAYLFYRGLDTSQMLRSDYWRVFFTPETLLGGFLTFALPLMAILIVHEMGHYVMARRHGMEASLPFFIPLPPFLSAVEIGTLGAFISMREPIPNRKALLDIGASGPVAGFVVAIPVLLIGMFLMHASPVYVESSDDSLLLGTPLLYNLLAMPFGFAENQVIHPTAFAGWVGLFVTAINLLPAGQLDGGHIAAALLGDKARYLSYAAVAGLLVLGLGVNALGLPGYFGWVVFALLIAFLGITHPPTLDGVSGLDRGRVLFGAATFALVFLCFTPVPISP